MLLLAEDMGLLYHEIMGMHLSRVSTDKLQQDGTSHVKHCDLVCNFLMKNLHVQCIVSSQTFQVFINYSTSKKFKFKFFYFPQSR